ncbi:hypothetical protein pb186bvf_002654 [Paramecium bursaria]
MNDVFENKFHSYDVFHTYMFYLDLQICNFIIQISTQSLQLILQNLYTIETSKIYSDQFCLINRFRQPQKKDN